MDGTIRLNKIDAARRQLKVAIRLLFDDEDPVAVHTLVGAASVIITDLVEKHHQMSPGRNSLRRQTRLRRANTIR